MTSDDGSEDGSAFTGRGRTRVHLPTIIIVLFIIDVIVGVYLSL